MAVIVDPGGAAIGIWQPGTHKGFGVHERVGTPGWFELHTRDYDAAVDFYRDVFGWDTHTASDTPEFRYTTLGEGEGSSPGSWTRRRSSAEGALALVGVLRRRGHRRRAGAGRRARRRSCLPAEDTPYGRLAAQAADPTGTPFKLVSDS